MEEKQAYFSLLQRKLKTIKFNGHAVGSSQMLSLWWIVSLDDQKHLSLKREQSYRNCTRAVLGALHTSGSGQLLSRPQHSSWSALRCITFLLMLQEPSPVHDQGRHSSCQECCCLTLGAPIQFGCCTDLYELEITFRGIKQGFSKSVQMSLKC